MSPGIKPTPPRMSITYWEAVHLLHNAHYPIGASITLAKMFGRDERVVHEDLKRGAP